jgi:hypothetical protein
MERQFPRGDAGPGIALRLWSSYGSPLHPKVTSESNPNTRFAVALHAKCAARPVAPDREPWIAFVVEGGGGVALDRAPCGSLR